MLDYASWMHKRSASAAIPCIVCGVGIVVGIYGCLHELGLLFAGYWGYFEVM